METQPNVCVLLDVGTRPGKNSIYRLWKAFDVNSNVGGACGEIAVYKGKNWKYLINPLGWCFFYLLLPMKYVLTGSRSFSSGGSEFRVQDKQHTRQAYRIFIRVYQRSGWLSHLRQLVSIH